MLSLRNELGRSSSSSLSTFRATFREQQKKKPSSFFNSIARHRRPTSHSPAYLLRQLRVLEQSLSVDGLREQAHAQFDKAACAFAFERRDRQKDAHQFRLFFSTSTPTPLLDLRLRPLLLSVSRCSARSPRRRHAAAAPQRKHSSACSTFLLPIPHPRAPPRCWLRLLPLPLP